MAAQIYSQIYSKNVGTSVKFLFNKPHPNSDWKTYAKVLYTFKLNNQSHE